MYSALADLVVATHFAFILFIAVGGFIAWRWPRLLWLHLLAVAWGIGIVVIGWDCPLTGLEHALRDRAGDPVNEGFIDRYVEGVIYPERYTGLLRALIAVAVLVGWAGVLVRRHDRLPNGSAMMDGSPSGTPTSAC